MPDWRPEIRSKLAALSLGTAREMEIVEELAQHLDDRFRQLVSAGRTEEAAAEEARRELGTTEELGGAISQVERPAPRDLPPPGAPVHEGWIAARWVDLRQSIRALCRTPTFTATVVVTMALTIGPTTAFLSIGNWLVWRPVPAVSDAGRLGMVWFGTWQKDGQGVRPSRISPLNIADLVTASKTIQSLAGTQEGAEAVAVEGRTVENIPAAHADANLFQTLGIRPSAGRFFTREEDLLPDGVAVAVISDGLARRAFGSPDTALGKAIVLNGQRLRVVGVAPKEFRGITPFSAVDVWYPGATYRRLHRISSTPPSATRSDGTFYSFVVRLRAGATFDAAQAELNVLAERLLERYPEENSKFKTVRARVFPGLGVDVLSRDQYQAIVQRLLLLGAVLVVLGCANVANLLMFRSVRRQREYGVRMALGAGRTRLLQLQLAESSLLAAAGGALGLGLALGMTQLILALVLPAALTSSVALTVPLDARVLLATLVLSIAGGLAAGLLPAWIGASRPVTVGLSQAGVRDTPRNWRLRAGFAAVQLALSLALLVGALLMVTTIRGLRGVDPGFNPNGVTVHYIDLRSQGYTPARAVTYVHDLDTALSAIPTLAAASFSSSYPLGVRFVQRIDSPGGGPDEPIEVVTNYVSSKYFAVLGIPIVKGRAFSAAGAVGPGDASGNVVIVSRALARRLFGNLDPLGRTVTIGLGKTRRESVVVGVAQDVLTDLVGGAAELTMYEPFAIGEFSRMQPCLLVKSTLTMRQAAEIVGAVASRVDSNTPIAFSQPLQTGIDQRLSDQRIFAWVLSLLGGLGFLLAAVGLYGLLAQSVVERTRELGIRMALGARPLDVVGLILRRAVMVTLIGAPLGLVLAFVGSRVIERLLFGVSRLDGWVYLAATGTLALVVLLAGIGPALRATRVHPVDVLRVE
jgi:predicted permease